MFRAFPPMNVSSTSTSPESFSGSVLQSKPDAMEHKRRGLLGNVDVPFNLVTADTVLAVDNHPNGGKPFVQTEWGILEDSPNLL